MMLVVFSYWSNSSRASTSSDNFIFSDASFVSSISISLISFFSFICCFSLKLNVESFISLILFCDSSLSTVSIGSLKVSSSINMLYLAFLILSFSFRRFCINRGMIFCSMMNSWYGEFSFSIFVSSKMLRETNVENITTIQKEQTIPMSVFAIDCGRLK